MCRKCTCQKICTCGINNNNVYKGLNPILGETMSTWHLDVWNMEEGTMCNLSWTTCKPTSFAMNAMMSWMILCVSMHSLPCEHHTKWMSKGLMGWVQTHNRRPTMIERWGNPSWIHKVMKKVTKIGQTSIGGAKQWTNYWGLGLNMKGCKFDGC